MSKYNQSDALIIIDVQNDFCPGGALEVKGGDAIVDGIVELSKQFQTVVLTQDNHPVDHSSFAVVHGKNPYETINMPYGEQTLWPQHCVQGTLGAAFHEKLRETEIRADLIIRKGMNREVDSYSAFFENDRVTSTGLCGYLEDKGIKRVVLVGLAFDFCVAYSALDAHGLGFKVTVIEDLTRGIGIPVGNENTISLMRKELKKLGIELA